MNKGRRFVHGTQLIFPVNVPLARSRFADSAATEERDAALAKMKERGLTVRQIQRLTGVSLGAISKA